MVEVDCREFIIIPRAARHAPRGFSYRQKRNIPKGCPLDKKRNIPKGCPSGISLAIGLSINQTVVVYQIYLMVVSIGSGAFAQGLTETEPSMELRVSASFTRLAAFATSHSIVTIVLIVAGASPTPATSIVFCA